jgi:transposase
VGDILPMSQRELSRLEVIQRVCRKTLTQRRAADLLSVSVRQVKRLCRAYRREGAAALASKRRGHPSNHQLRPELVNAARELLRARYYDFGPTLAREKLSEADDLNLGVETVRRLMIAEGLWRVRRARQVVIHQLRERRASLGELVQLDGSPHDWFEGRAERCTLLNFVDDATSRLMHLSFVDAETTFNYFAAVRAYVLEHGKPRAFYSDKLGVFRVNMPSPVSGTGLTQFGRAMAELSIELLCAHSPQAKGRVERANQTLQDRLVKELRLRSICSAAEADAYLPEFIRDYNRRFAVAPRSAQDAHRPLEATEDLARSLSWCETRVLSKNLTLSYDGCVYQIKTDRAAYTMRGARVEVRETEAGAVSIEYKSRPLPFSLYQQQEREQGQVVEPKLIEARLRRGTEPKPKREGVALSHPWRDFNYSEKSIAAREKRGELCRLRK